MKSQDKLSYISKEIHAYEERLALLRIQKAKKGINTESYIGTDISDAQKEIDDLCELEHYW